MSAEVRQRSATTAAVADVYVPQFKTASMSDSKADLEAPASSASKVDADKDSARLSGRRSRVLGLFGLFVTGLFLYVGLNALSTYLLLERARNLHPSATVTWGSRSGSMQLTTEDGEMISTAPAQEEVPLALTPQLDEQELNSIQFVTARVSAAFDFDTMGVDKSILIKSLVDGSKRQKIKLPVVSYDLVDATKIHFRTQDGHFVEVNGGFTWLRRRDGRKTFLDGATATLTAFRTSSSMSIQTALLQSKALWGYSADPLVTQGAHRRLNADGALPTNPDEGFLEAGQCAHFDDIDREVATTKLREYLNQTGMDLAEVVLNPEDDNETACSVATMKTLEIQVLSDPQNAESTADDEDDGPDFDFSLLSNRTAWHELFVDPPDDPDFEGNEQFPFLDDVVYNDSSMDEETRRRLFGRTLSRRSPIEFRAPRKRRAISPDDLIKSFKEIKKLKQAYDEKKAQYEEFYERIGGSLSAQSDEAVNLDDIRNAMAPPTSSHCSIVAAEFTSLHAKIDLVQARQDLVHSGTGLILAVTQFTLDLESVAGVYKFKAVPLKHTMRILMALPYVGKILQKVGSRALDMCKRTLMNIEKRAKSFNDHTLTKQLRENADKLGNHNIKLSQHFSEIQALIDRDIQTPLYTTSNLCPALLGPIMCSDALKATLAQLNANLENNAAIEMIERFEQLVDGVVGAFSVLIDALSPGMDVLSPFLKTLKAISDVFDPIWNILSKRIRILPYPCITGRHCWRVCFWGCWNICVPRFSTCWVTISIADIIAEAGKALDWAYGIIEDLVKAVIGNAFEDAIRSLFEKIMPNINFPDINFPTVQLPSLEWPSFLLPCVTGQSCFDSIFKIPFDMGC